MKTRYARAQEENAQLRVTNSELLQNSYKLIAEQNILRNTVMKLTAELTESMTERDTLARTLVAANAKLEEITLERNRINRGVARHQNRAVFNLPRPVDDSRLREMALSMASSLVGSGEFVTTRAQKYLDFLKGDAEPKQPPFADGEGVFE